MKRFVFVYVAIAFLSCSGNGSLDFARIGEKEILYHQMLIVDSLTIDASTMSLDGWWGIYGDRLFYVDKQQVYVKYFDTTGSFIERKFARGRGPNELLGPPVFFGHTTEDEMIYIDGNWFFHRFNVDGEELYSHHFLDDIIFSNSDWQDLLQNPDPENVMMYEIEFQYRTFAFYRDWIIIPITTEHISYNGFDKMSHAKEFYKHSYTLGAFNRQTFFQERFFGHYPLVYRKKIIPNFMTNCVAADEDYLYVSYEADPLLYAYNDRLELTFAFGFEGEGMKTNYPETSSVEQAMEQLKTQRKSYDYYGMIHYEFPYLFRNYTSRGAIHFQVYENSNLVGDINTGRKEFQLIGYIAPYYYACIACDIDHEQYRIIRFHLE